MFHKLRTKIKKTHPFQKSQVYAKHHRTLYFYPTAPSTHCARLCWMPKPTVSKTQPASAKAKWRRMARPVLNTLLHAYHCRNIDCSHVQCAEAKITIDRMAGHAKACKSKWTDQCKMCKFLQMLGKIHVKLDDCADT